MKNLILTNLHSIVIVSDNNVLGLRDKPYMHWARKIPRDMNNFTEITTGKNNHNLNGVIMGRETLDTLPDKFKPLPNRENIILSRSTVIQAENTRCFSDIDSVLDFVQSQPKREFFVMGGNQIYEQFFPHVGGSLHITRVHETFDTPPGNEIVTCISEFRTENAFKLLDQFHKVKNEYHEIDEKNHYPITLEVYRRKSFSGSDLCQTC